MNRSVSSDSPTVWRPRMQVMVVAFLVVCLGGCGDPLEDGKLDRGELESALRSVAGREAPKVGRVDASALLQYESPAGAVLEPVEVADPAALRAELTPKIHEIFMVYKRLKAEMPEPMFYLMWYCEENPEMPLDELVVVYKALAFHHLHEIREIEKAIKAASTP